MCLSAILPPTDPQVPVYIRKDSVSPSRRALPMSLDDTPRSQSVTRTRKAASPVRVASVPPSHSRRVSFDSTSLMARALLSGQNRPLCISAQSTSSTETTSVSSVDSHSTPPTSIYEDCTSRTGSVTSLESEFCYSTSRRSSTPPGAYPHPSRRVMGLASVKRALNNRRRRSSGMSSGAESGSDAFGSDLIPAELVRSNSVPGQRGKRRLPFL
jgi:hypothetical protein